MAPMVLQCIIYTHHIDFFLNWLHWLYSRDILPGFTDRLNWLSTALPEGLISTSMCAFVVQSALACRSVSPSNFKNSPLGKLSMGPLSKAQHSTVRRGGLKDDIFTLKHQTICLPDLHKSVSMALSSQDVFLCLPPFLKARSKSGCQGQQHFRLQFSELQRINGKGRKKSQNILLLLHDCNDKVGIHQPFIHPSLIVLTLVMFRLSILYTAYQECS